MDDHDEENRTEQNLVVRNGKAEAEITIQKGGPYSEAA